MPLLWTKAKPIPAPTDLELELVEALETVTECAQEHVGCSDAIDESRELLERAKTTLGIVPRSDDETSSSAQAQRSRG
jgi:hypothetical protein